MVEAMEVAELYCDLLLARFGMLEQMTYLFHNHLVAVLVYSCMLHCRYCEDSLAEAVATLIWVAPRLSADIPELNQVGSDVDIPRCLNLFCCQVSLQLENKFGKPFVQQARSNLSGAVNAKVVKCYGFVWSSFRVIIIIVKVIHRLGAEAPKKSLVENYMIEIARNYKIDYQPDPTMFLVSHLPCACVHDGCDGFMSCRRMMVFQQVPRWLSRLFYRMDHKQDLFHTNKRFVTAAGILPFHHQPRVLLLSHLTKG